MRVSTTLTIAKKDFKAYFTSPIGYVFMAVFSFIMGLMFFSILNYYVQQGMQYEQLRYGHKPSITDQLIRPIWGNMNFILLLVVPFITMRLFAEEKKNNTIELLFTAPVRLTEIIIGKFLSAMGFVSVLMLLTVPFLVALKIAVNPDWSVIATSYLGTLLMVGTYVGIGLLCSSVTENQIIAVVLTFGAILLLWIIRWPAYNAGPFWSDLLGYLSVIDHYEDFSRGVISTKDVSFYLSTTGLFLFLTYKTLESYTWRS